MIQSFIVLLLAVIARITAWVYKSKFKFLSKLELPLTIIIIIIACVFAALLIFTVINEIKDALARKRKR